VGDRRSMVLWGGGGGGTAGQHVPVMLQAPFTAGAAERFAAALASPHDAVVQRLPYGAGGSAVALRGSDFQRFQSDTWLNDELVNAYMYLLGKREASLLGGGARNVFFTSHFFAKLLGPGGAIDSDGLDALVTRWARKYEAAGGTSAAGAGVVGAEAGGVDDEDILAVWTGRQVGGALLRASKIFVPVNIGDFHWALAVVDVERREFRYYDSLGGGGQHYLSALREFLARYARRHSLHRLEVERWSMVPRMPGPRQGNGSDCAVFTCMTAEYLARALPFDFGLTTAAEGRHSGLSFRVLMALGLLKGELWYRP